MNRIILLVAFCILYSFPVISQDFFGAQNTGKHTWGVNVKYNGDFWLGTHYNNRKFSAKGKRPLDTNFIVEMKVKKGGTSIAGELGFAQVYADGNDFKSGFGLGTRYGLRGEFCPIIYKNKDKSKTPCGSLSVNTAIKPGAYHFVKCYTANVEVDIAYFYFGCAHLNTKKDPIVKKNTVVRFFDRIGVGAHADWNNSAKGKGRYVITADANHSFYLGRKEKGAWNTYYNFPDHIPVKADFITEEKKEDKAETKKVQQVGSCTMPPRNFAFKLSHSMRF